MTRLQGIYDKFFNSNEELPSREDQLLQLHKRVDRLEESLIQAGSEDEEFLITEEIKRIKELIKFIKDFRSTSTYPLNLITATYEALEGIVINHRELILESLDLSKQLKDIDIALYNNALYHYNEYCNMIESLI